MMSVSNDSQCHLHLVSLLGLLYFIYFNSNLGNEFIFFLLGYPHVYGLHEI